MQDTWPLEHDINGADGARGGTSLSAGKYDVVRVPRIRQDLYHLFQPPPKLELHPHKEREREREDGIQRIIITHEPFPTQQAPRGKKDLSSQTRNHGHPVQL